MWLLETRSYVLRNKFSRPVEYAILSHTREDEEVTLQDMQNLAVPSKKAEWEKVKQTCKLACRQGFRYVWIDTYCINKDSSAELTQAINSMFDWYRSADECYAYLRSKAYLTDPLSQITWADPVTPNDPENLHMIPVGRKMSWAATRKTRIFDVNIPLIYGEGLKAFLRLQEAVANKTSDLSLFA
ncbi:heterokaryon incompatibility protein-domain-containing protein [Podospora didyma]|uniref:Heterokaryon incompatibility protein-domain-containing protein n=1 Tax=Podospora didyma TaxID=330526 RepID=A0AAE0N4D3_9PEZI|nr:heterokaryon incompatibility protein-domain-containing protein [Podospora didyma]